MDGSEAGFTVVEREFLADTARGRWTRMNGSGT